MLDCWGQTLVVPPLPTVFAEGGKTVQVGRFRYMLLQILEPSVR